ncbi:related to voltage gated Ca2+ channel [Cephalotrichum gorgonifer]|uniref:Calcium-channel protein CCH1 n=1 Tax=Cephalotrichum gorgonifer TaxID=2041049 RepID=A0AAE8MQX9_9PEZI|nr:related to voltage gated Ca2+ channel [Cephalotrichum gorgonifer]
MSGPRPPHTGEHERRRPGSPPNAQSIQLQTLHDSPQEGRLLAASHLLPSQGRDSRDLASRPGPSSYWDQSYGSMVNEGRPRDGHGANRPESPIDMSALQFALPPGIDQPSPEPSFGPALGDPYDTPAGYYERPSIADNESDTAPLTSRAEPIAGALSPGGQGSQPRDSFQTVSDVGNSPSRSGDRHTRLDLGQGYGASLAPGDFRRSRPPSTSGALYKAGSIVRAMSQRVVNISGEGETLDRRPSRRRSRSPGGESRPQSRHQSILESQDTSYPSQLFPPPGSEKKSGSHISVNNGQFSPMPGMPSMNPLKGKSLGVFSPENPIRKALCELLIHSWTEFIILVLIIAQTILLAIEAAPNVFEEGNARPDRWGKTRIDWAMLGLFIIFTLEIVARIIVSGFILNAAEYSTIDRQRGVRAAVADQYKLIFQPERQKSVRGPRQTRPEPPAFARSFTFAQRNQTSTIEDQRRWQLARRAFLRHGFNRLDFVAVVAFWISFVMGVLGLEKQHHLYIFRMLSCLRIIRLLALTNGTAIILRSLKKATPLLVRVAFLVAFFWILFAIIGVQSFKTSLSRTCVWLDPLDPTNKTASFTNSFGFCGGYLDNSTGEKLPWVMARNPDDLSDLIPAADSGKGLLCPRGSICLQGDNPYNGTVHFDNILHSLELVFVIMSANTFSDLMYYTIDSDYPPAALFFGAGIMIMMLWLTNLLIAVITSSFQVIREESKASAFTSAEAEPAPLPVPDAVPKRLSALQRLYQKTSIFWVIIIAFGLVAQACRSSTMGPGRERFVNSSEIVVTILLDVDIVARFLSDWRGFHRSWRNLFDLGLAVITSVILIPPIRNSGTPYAWLTVFQVLRAYRIVMAVPVTRKLIILVLGNAMGIGNLMLFVFLITFIMAIFAVQLFRGEIPQEDEEGELYNVAFFTIFNAFLGMYQILTSENWTSMLYAVTAAGREFNTGWIGAIFLMGWFVLSFFILVNMFIAVIQENFDVSEDEKRLEQVKAFLHSKETGKTSNNLALSTIFHLGRSRKKMDPLDYGPATMEMLLKEAVVKEFLDDEAGPLQESDGPQGPVRQYTMAMGDITPGILSTLWGKLTAKIGGKEPNPFYSNIRFDGPNETLDPRQMAQQAVSATSARRKAQREYLARHPSYNNSLFIFTPHNPIRRLCQRLVGPGRGSQRFDGVEPNKVAWYTFSAFIYVVIVAMVILACITTPLYQKEYRENHEFSARNWYVWTDLAFAGVFTIEAMIKVVADGFFWTPNAYYRSSWGVIDAVVLISLWIYVFTLLANDGAVSRAVGAFKALRALRLLNISSSAQDTFHNVIIWGMWKIVPPAFVSISLLIPFAIYGLNLFNGALLSCNDGSDGIVRIDDCFGEYNSAPYREDWPILAPRVASNPYLNFDDFGSALFSLFQIVSQEGWIDLSYAAQAITGPRLQPQSFARQGNAVFFVIFNLLATVFVLTLFISVFMRNYTEQTGVAFLTTEQRSWLELRKLLRQISPSKTSYNDKGDAWKKWCHKRAIEKRGTWYTTITFVLVCHLGLLVSEFSTEPAFWARVRGILFFVFILLYVANVAIRIIGLGWSRFRRSSWDLYSLVVSTGAFGATMAVLITETEVQTYVQLHKFFLVALVLLVIPRNDALDQLFKTAAASLTKISNLLATWLIFFLIFAIAMTQAFSLTRFGPEEGNGVNLRTVPNALILLFRVSCGEGWNDVMEDFANIEPPLCVESDDFFNSDCGSKPWARFLFVAWNILSMYIFVNLFVSLIYESFSYVYQKSNGLAVVDRDEIRRFKEAWRSVDPAGTGFISKEAFPRLLGELSGVFEMRVYDSDDSVRQILEDVRSDNVAAANTRHMSIGTAAGYSTGVDLDKLNERLSHLDVARVRERRRRFNIFYEEMMVSADVDKGISFTNVMMTIAHYNVINDSKSLKLEEFLRRRARLQLVEEAVRRKVVLGFFETLYWSRQFQRHMDAKRAGRMTDVPQLGIPDIYVDDDDTSGGEGESGFSTERGSRKRYPSNNLRVEDATSSYRSTTTAGEPAEQPYQHPLGSPRTSLTQGLHRQPSSAVSFDLQTQADEPGTPVSPVGGDDLTRRTSGGGSYRVQDMLDDSVWSPRLQSIAARFAPSTLRTSFRRSFSASSRASSNRDSIVSSASSPVSTINSIIFRQPSIAGLEEERRSFGNELGILEPRPIVYWAGVEERMASF